jgi:hypothetical protein
MLRSIVALLLILWLLGFLMNIGGAFVHILLVVGLAVIAYNLLTGRNPSAGLKK